MRQLSGARYKTVEGLVRGVAVLRALNRVGRGWATPSDISRHTGIHRTTVRRLLETLLIERCVRRSPSDDTYRLALGVRELTEGFTDDEWVSEVASPVMGDLLQKVVWPSDLGTLEGDVLIIRETNRRFSSLSFHRNTVGKKLPLLCTAMGKAYFAWCSDEERRLLVRLMIANKDEHSAQVRNPSYVNQLVEKTRSDGVAVNDGEWVEEPHVAAIALPIHHGTKLLGCLNVVFLKRVLPVKEATSRYLPALRAAVYKIEAGCSRKIPPPEPVGSSREGPRKPKQSRRS
jgi:IclR family mhp operon transcriptional activator